jgi:formylmethanofuran:tetrahydromethanopterin formyltransferase
VKAMIKRAEVQFTDQELFMAKQPINIMFFSSLSNKLYPNIPNTERNKLLPSLFSKLSDSKIHSVINRLARLKLKGELSNNEISDAIEMLVEAISKELN